MAQSQREVASLIPIESTDQGDTLSSGPSSSESLAPGKVFANDYLIEALLGAGGFGVVYRARHVPSGERVAIKLLRSQPAPTPTRLDRSTVLAEPATTSSLGHSSEEAALLARLSHPGVVGFRQLGQHEDTAFLVTELVEGESLQLIAEARALTASPDQAAELMVPVVEALGYLHSRGVFHLDVKPANIIRSASGQLKLVDLGISSVKGSARLGGTLLYLSPEQTGLSAHRPDGRSDLYSLGATLYHLAVGVPPFLVGNVNEAFLAHLKETPRNPRELNASVSPALAAIILRLLAKVPARRYPDASALLKDLRRYLDVAENERPTYELPSPHGLSLATSSTRGFVGRRLELERLRAVPGGEPALALLTGRPGLGRSELLQRAAERWAADGALVAQCQARHDSPLQLAVAALAQDCVAHLHRLPHAELARWRDHLAMAPKVILQLQAQVPGLRELTPSLVGTVPETSDAARLRSLIAWRALLGWLAEGPTPVVWCVDEVQHLDADSWAVLRTHAELSGRLPGSWVLSHAPGLLPAGDEQLTRLLNSLTATRPLVLPLAPLRPDEVRELVERELAEDPAAAELAAALHRSSRGLPTLVHAGLEVARRKGVVKGRRVDFEQLAALQLPASEHDQVATQLASLGGVARGLAVTAAMLGATLERRHLAWASGMSEEELAEPLGELLTSGVLRQPRQDETELLAFSGELCVALLRERATVAGHRSMADALGARAASLAPSASLSAVVGEQFALAGDEHHAACWWARAGRQLLDEGCFGPAARLAEKAAARVRGPLRVDGLLLDELLGDALAAVARYTEACAAFERALEGETEPSARRRLRGKLAGSQRSRLDFSRSIASSLEVVRELGLRPPAHRKDRRPLLVQLGLYVLGVVLPFLGRRAARRYSVEERAALLRSLDALSHGAYFTGDLTLMLWSHLALLNYARDFADVSMLSRVWGQHVMLVTALPRPLLARARWAARRAVGLAERAPDRTARGAVGTYAGYLESFRGDYPAACETHERAGAAARETGDFLSAYFNSLGLVTMDIRSGRLKVARRRLNELMVDLAELGRGDATARTHYYLADVCYCEGDTEGALELSTKAVETMSRLGDNQLVARASWIRIGALWRLRRDEEALLEAEKVLDLIDAHGLAVDFVTQSICFVGELACSALELGEASPRWLALRDRAAQAASRRTRTMPSFRCAALRLSARVARAERREVDALRLLAQAEEVGTRIGLRPEVARCLELRGRWLWEVEQAQATDALMRALQLFEETGFKVDAARVRELLAAPRSGRL